MSIKNHQEICVKRLLFHFLKRYISIKVYLSLKKQVSMNLFLDKILQKNPLKSMTISQARYNMIYIKKLPNPEYIFIETC